MLDNAFPTAYDTYSPSGDEDQQPHCANLAIAMEPSPTLSRINYGLDRDSAPRNLQSDCNIADGCMYPFRSAVAFPEGDTQMTNGNNGVDFSAMVPLDTTSSSNLSLMNHARDILRAERDQEISIENFKHPTTVLTPL
jgi:hypothetical protein